MKSRTIQKGDFTRLTRRRFLGRGMAGLTAALAGTLPTGGCRKTGTGPKQPNVILISIDTTRRDHCSVYGYEKDTTPNLRAFAEDATVFDLAYSPSSTTGPSHASFFTALYPMSHHVIKNGFTLAPEHATIAQILKERGYQTAAVVGSFVLHSKFGYANGFDFYDDQLVPEEAKLPRMGRWEGLYIDEPFDRRAEFVSQRVVNWLRHSRDRSSPFFFFVHYFDPHNPYSPIEPFRSAFAPKDPSAGNLDDAIGRYDAEIASADHAIGQLLQSLKDMKLEENTLVVITSDHGEGLMEHNHMYHGVNIYEEAVRVPLLIRLGGLIPKAHNISTAVGLTGLAPTLLELAGIDAGKLPFQCPSFARLIFEKKQVEFAKPLYLYRRHYKGGIEVATYVKGEKFGIRHNEWKYIDGPQEQTQELFNLLVDPGELNNVCGGHTHQTQNLVAQLDRWRKHCTSAATAQSSIPPEDLEKLKSLGYVE